MKSLHKRPTKRRRGSRRHVALRTETQRSSDVEGLYWCMEFYRLTDCLKLRMEGRFVRDFAEHARMLIGDSILPPKLIVDLSEVNYVDAVGEEVLLWFKEIGVKFIAESAYSHGVCERLRLPNEGELSAVLNTDGTEPACVPRPSKQPSNVSVHGGTRL